jgi:hypothetical protein
MAMRFMVVVKADEDSEAGVLPEETYLAEMGRFNEDLVKSGMLVAAEGLHPSSKASRVTFSGAETTVADGPFAEARAVIAGFWIVDMESKDAAVEWFKRCPMPTPETKAEIDIYPVFGADEFSGEQITPVLTEQEARLRAHAAEGTELL